MTSSESEGQVPSRKRSRTNNSAEEGAKKARGRPRVDTQDATAADVSCFTFLAYCETSRPITCPFYRE